MSTNNICFYRLIEAIQICTNNICFYKEIQYKQSTSENNITKASLNNPIMKSTADLFLKCVLIRWIFYKFFFRLF